MQYKEYGYQSNKASCAHGYLLNNIVSLLNNKKNKTILDVGCGNGFIAGALIKTGYTVYGVDASKEGINIAKQFYPDNFFVHDLSTNKLPEELNLINFDTIISTEVIEHLYAPRNFISLCKNILKQNSGGEIILSTPYHGYLKNLVLALSGKFDKHFTALWDGGHIKFWSYKTIKLLLEEQGFKVIKFVGSGRFPYLWKSMIIKAEL